MLQRITSKRNALIVLGVVLLLAIAFETMQQLYYIRRYDLVQGVTFWELLKGQASRWVIWFLLGVLLYFFCIRQFKKTTRVLLYFIKLTGVIVGLVLLNVILISLLQLIVSEDPLWSPLLFTEYLPFYIFQKAPIYTLGYIAIAVVLQFYYTKEQLEVEIFELKDIRTQNLELKEELSKIPEDEIKVLTIKIGNKRRIVAIDQIRWIEADDYCVKVHTKNNESLTMRISMKAINEMLGNQFLRVHRKAIVNIQEVETFDLSNPPKIVLTNKQEILVSKGQLKTVRALFN